jgi:hypothetical protein
MFSFTCEGSGYDLLLVVLELHQPAAQICVLPRLTLKQLRLNTNLLPTRGPGVEEVQVRLGGRPVHSLPFQFLH